VQGRITSVKNTIRGILTRYNADRQDLFTQVGWKAAMQTNLLKEERWLLDELHHDLQEGQARLAAVDDRLAEFAEQAPLKEREARAVLATHPGVGPVTIETILAELGDWERFRCADAVVSFAGLAPGVRESDGRRKDLKLSKSGSPLLRWILIQLAHRVKRTTARWRRVFERLSKRIGNKKATCAIARRLLLVIYAMLRDGQAYRFAAVA
jgi:transposase